MLNIPDFSWQKNRDTDKDAFRFMRKKVKKGNGPLGKRLDQEFKSLVNVNKPAKGLV